MTGKAKKSKAASGASYDVRLMTLELVIADMLATVHRNTADPLRSLNVKRSRFRWLMEESKGDIADSTLGQIYPEELQAAIDQLFAMAEVLVRRRDLT